MRRIPRFSSWTSAVILSVYRVVSSLRVVTISSGLLPDIGTPALVSTMQVALDMFEKKYPTVCTNYTYHWEGLDVGDTMCDDQPETENFQNVLARLYSEHLLDNDGPTVVLSTACPKVFASIANYAKEQDILALTFVETDEMFRDKNKFPTMLSSSLAKASDYGTMLVKLMDRFHWTSISVINDALSMWHGVGGGRKNWITCFGVLEALRQRHDILVTEVSADSVQPGWAQRAVQQASEHSRTLTKKATPVIVTCTLDVQQREIAAAAYDLRMTNGDYVFIHLSVTETSFESPLACCKNDSLDEKVKEAYSNYLVIRSAPVDWVKMADFTSAVSAHWLQNFGKPPTPWPYRGIYGAELMLSGLEGLESIVQSIEKDMRQKAYYNFSAKTVAASMWNKSFFTTSRTVSMDEAGIRATWAEVQQWNRSLLDFQAIATINSSTYSLIPILSRNFTWKNGAPPPDTPACGIHNERCVQTDMLPIVLGTALAVAVMIGSILLGWFSRSKHAHNFEEWAVTADEVDYPAQTPFDKNIVKLAKRVRVVKEIQTVVSLPVSDSINPALLKKSGNKTKNRLGTLLFQITRLHHENVNRMAFVSLVPPSVFYECCERGSLEDLPEAVRADWTMKTSFLQDLVEGVNAIHHSALHYHGNLKPTQCLITQRFGLKVGDLGKESTVSLLTGQAITPSPSEYSAPETASGKWSAASDIYSMSVIADRIFDIKESMPKFDFANKEQAMPSKEVMIAGQLLDITQLGRSQNSTDRPTITAYRKKLTTVFGKKLAVLESLMSRLEKHASDLEDSVFQRQAELLLEQRKCDDLLNEMLPGTVVRTLRMGLTVPPEIFDSVTMYVSYVAEFAAFVATKSPFEVVSFLHDLYTKSDKVTSKLDVYKLETINDSQLLVSGLPTRNDSFHCREICDMAMRLLTDFDVIGVAHGLALQIGLHSGPVAAAVAGQKRPRYCLFGDTINTASRMASNGLPGKIHLSPACADLATYFGFLTELRGEMEIKGKGMIRTYWLVNDLRKRTNTLMSGNVSSETSTIRKRTNTGLASNASAETGRERS